MTKKYIYIVGFLLLVASASSLFLFKYKQGVAPEPSKIDLKAKEFNDLPGWDKSDPRVSLKAFKTSCKAFLKQHPEKPVGSKHISLQAKDWQPICKAARLIDDQSQHAAKHFFETWFSPVIFHDKTPVNGLFTGYYMPLLKGSLTKTKQYSVPIYGVPSNLIAVDFGRFDSDLKHHRRAFGRVKNKSIIPYYTREQIVNGSIDNVAPIVAWIEHRVDRQFLEIEGSGVIELDDGKKVTVGYAAQSGAPYTSIAKILIDKGVLTKDNASMQRIRKYFKDNPDQIDTVLNQNKSFVFFDRHPREEALGSQGVPLTPGYSLAVDRKWIPMGVPLWLSTTRPDQQAHETPMERLMIAQDTGGAIKGPVRGDVYWGTGDEAIFIAGHMKNRGYYWLLLPKSYLDENPDKHQLS